MSAYNIEKSDARIKLLMEQVGMPNSRSLFQAFKQLEQEVRTELGHGPWDNSPNAMELQQ